MAKKQTFESKTKKGGVDLKVIKLVFPYKSQKTGTWKFAERLVKVPQDANEQQFLDQEIQNGVAYLERHH